MPKLYIISDVHGFFDEMKAALDEAGFDENNPEHWLIGCGDYMDRGKQPIQVMRYLHHLPRKILIRGNHEKLLEDCCLRGEAWSHDIHNGTADTIWNIGCSLYHDFAEMCDHTLRRTKAFRDSMVNYFETKNFVFCHSFLPLIEVEGEQRFKPDWRNATQDEWDKAMWGNPYQLAEKGLLPSDKKLVFGHFHTSWPRAHYDGEPEWGSEADFSVYYGDGFIAIDACTAYSGKVNVLVLEDDFLEE